MTTTLNHPVAGHHLASTVSAGRVQSAHVYADQDHTQLVGLVQARQADGSEWMVSLGEGWIVGVTPRDIYDAIDTLATMRADLDATTARLKRLCGAATTPELRADLRGLIHDLAGARVAPQVFRLAAANLQFDLY